MSAPIIQALLATELTDSQLVNEIRSHGGFAYQSKALCRHEWRKLQLSNVELGGIRGTGPGLLGAARDWRRKAIAQVQL